MSIGMRNWREVQKMRLSFCLHQSIQYLVQDAANACANMRKSCIVCSNGHFVKTARRSNSNLSAEMCVPRYTKVASWKLFTLCCNLFVHYCEARPFTYRALE